ncbi:hypothetical protein SAMN04515674_104252 [Pseudarcicella hirudinis]|uniref:Uncharacterized protein n=1 Tax=Pseudarcicella hirudinis TaxID=1079859 RepID=A0A1I5RW25_9BACT|nr:hypothetical protein [Pseudarcicella hirudinis]SFP62176.1 hypothetical protein SAMN04515674_104252 [Pseudarcicella hirudinis]
MEDNQREQEVQKLCKGVLETNAVYEGNYDSYHPSIYQCPFCFSDIEAINYKGLQTIIHDIDCPYLIAKDLSTNVNPK